MDKENVIEFLNKGSDRKEEILVKDDKEESNVNFSKLLDEMQESLALAFIQDAKTLSIKGLIDQLEVHLKEISFCMKVIMSTLESLKSKVNK